MKLTAFQQQSRRSNSFRGSSTLDSSVDGTIKSSAAIFWLVLHGLCCLISLVLGFRFSRLVFFLLFSSNSTSNLYSSTAFHSVAENLPFGTVSSTSLSPVVNKTTAVLGAAASSRVVVGRHGILIRPWPHPNPTEVMKAHQIIERVQREQRLQYGVKSPKTVIAITPTYVRTFQALHLTGVMHSLMNVPYDLVWIVVEAGGATNETASLIAKSGLRTIHVGFLEKMPILWEDRHKLESRMRIHALRVVREKMLDGVVMFADDSNMHSMDLFDEIQNVKWFGAVSVGVLAHSGGDEDQVTVVKEEEESSSGVPIQGPACNSSNHLVGWHIFNSAPLIERSARYIGDRATVLPRKMEWAGFVLNSRLVWKDVEDKPEWAKDFDIVAADGKDFESPLSLLKDTSVVEPLGSCGRKVMLWWLRVEARADSKFPAGWTIDPPLEVTVPAKRTPWPDAPPELPASEKVITVQENIIEKRVTKTRSPRKRRSKRKHAAKTIVDERVTSRHSVEN
ncbi:hypothetical protein M9H77_05741 [Catharanthus roseus]|uniref:Uncharacterized protein n=1 Tax=Catharanthus roseus TaxID=4058 RepID=A0ACC0CI60_CATRO|nr:hypothetical protein M9H77_05741 [Catharanthus roseus]